MKGEQGLKGNVVSTGPKGGGEKEMQGSSGPMGPPGSKGEIGKNGGKNPKKKLVLQGQEVRS